MNIKQVERRSNIIEILNNEYYELSVFPDIIVHKRGTNIKNTLAIEVKKSTSNVNREYDYLKLRCYTDISEANTLKYDYGIFIKLHTGKQKYITPEIVWFKNGEIIR